MLIECSANYLSAPDKLIQQIKNALGAEPLRWGVIAHNEDKQSVQIEAIACPWPIDELARIDKKMSAENLGMMLVPTGIGCSIGGFGGDANLCANLIANEFDHLIINPNVVNGGAWQNIPANALYVEGLAIDLFLQGSLALRPVVSNRIGLVFDKAIPESLIQRELEVLKAAETIWGIDCIGYTITESPITPSIELLENGCSSGNIQNPEALLKAAEKLKARGAQAIAVMCCLDDCSSTRVNNDEDEQSEDLDLYTQGLAPDPIGGVEAVISHLLTRYLLLPAAHAPCFAVDTSVSNIPASSIENAEKGFPLSRGLGGNIIDPRVSPEETSFSFLPSVLKGLSKAPRLITKKELQLGDLSVHNLNSFVGPSDCWGGASFLVAAFNEEITSYAVQSNVSKVNIDASFLGRKIKKAANYLELVGHLKAKSLGLKISNY